MATTQEMQSRIESYARQLAEEFGVIDASQALSWLDAVETQAVAIGDALATELVRRKATERPVAAAESSCPECGAEGRYQGERERPLITRRGTTRIAEPEYYCPCCRKDFFPADPQHWG